MALQTMADSRSCFGFALLGVARGDALLLMYFFYFFFLSIDIKGVVVYGGFDLVCFFVYDIHTKVPSI